VFLPAVEKATGAAVIIAPGGGHQLLNFDQEGANVATYLNSIGIAGFVLKYRLDREPGSTYKAEDALADIEQAIRVVRNRAAEWHVNPARVGIIGFSAGGEVAALAATRFDAPEAQGSPPDFTALTYAGIRAYGNPIPANIPRTFMLRPVAEGSLSLRKKPVRPKDLQACAKGEGH